MTVSRNDSRRTLAHLRRLTREATELLQSRPLDELAHARWIERTLNYVHRKMPGVKILPLDQLVPVTMPDLLRPGFRLPHPLDAAMRRSNHGQQLIRKLRAILASAMERLELELETDGK